MVATWSQGDLAAAVRTLQAVLADTPPLPAGFWEGKARRMGLRLPQGVDGPCWAMQGDDGPMRYRAAEEAVESLGTAGGHRETAFENTGEQGDDRPPFGNALADAKAAGC